MADKENQQDEFQERVVKINRVAKVVKGGRRFSLTALVVVGNGKGKVGFGLGKASEVSTAIQKAVQRAKKSLITVPMNEHNTIPHEIIGHSDAADVLLKPASPGTGVIAGGPVRAVLELAGISDILTKSLGTSNAVSMIRATFDGLTKLKNREHVAALRSPNKLPEQH